MSTDKIDPSKKDTMISSADDLVKTTKKSDVELSEEDLKRIAGGQKSTEAQHYTIKLTNANISS